MRLGINTVVWGDAVGPDVVARFGWLRELGYDGVEVPILAPETIDVALIRDALAGSGLACTASTALPAGASLLEADERETGLAFLRDCLAIAGALGAAVLCGPLYAPVGQHRHAPTGEEREHFVAAMRELAPDADRLGVRLAIEPLNRFETGFLNTVDDGVRLVERIDRPAVGLLADTFHMNVEERAVPAALRRALPALSHVHLSANDRGTVGTGHLPWREIAAALQDGSYDGWVVFETFAGHIPQLAQATAIWRPLIDSPDQYAADSLRAVSPWFTPDIPEGDPIP